MRASVSDRAGVGWSDLSPKPRTAEDIVEELHTLLTRETYQALAAADTKFLEIVIAEQKVFKPDLAQVRAARITTLGNIPPIVLSRGQSDLLPSANISPAVIQQEEQAWQQLQIELTILSVQGKQVMASQSGHYIQLA